MPYHDRQTELNAQYAKPSAKKNPSVADFILDHAEEEELRGYHRDPAFSPDFEARSKPYHFKEFWIANSGLRCRRCGRCKCKPHHHWTNCTFLCFWCRTFNHPKTCCKVNGKDMSDMHGMPRIQKDAGTERLTSTGTELQKVSSVGKPLLALPTLPGSKPPLGHSMPQQSTQTTRSDAQTQTSPTPPPEYTPSPQQAIMVPPVNEREGNSLRELEQLVLDRLKEASQQPAGAESKSRVFQLLYKVFVMQVKTCNKALELVMDQTTAATEVEASVQDSLKAMLSGMFLTQAAHLQDLVQVIIDSRVEKSKDVTRANKVTDTNEEPDIEAVVLEELALIAARDSHQSAERVAYEHHTVHIGNLAPNTTALDMERLLHGYKYKTIRILTDEKIVPIHRFIYTYALVDFCSYIEAVNAVRTLQMGNEMTIRLAEPGDDPGDIDSTARVKANSIPTSSSNVSKSQDLANTTPSPTDPDIPRKRGRPRKSLPDATALNSADPSPLNPAKKRGRPRKSDGSSDGIESASKKVKETRVVSLSEYAANRRQKEADAAGIEILYQALSPRGGGRQVQSETPVAGGTAQSAFFQLAAENAIEVRRPNPGGDV